MTNKKTKGNQETGTKRYWYKYRSKGLWQSTSDGTGETPLNIGNSFHKRSQKTFLSFS